MPISGIKFLCILTALVHVGGENQNNIKNNTTCKVYKKASGRVDMKTGTTSLIGIGPDDSWTEIPASANKKWPGEYKLADNQDNDCPTDIKKATDLVIYPSDVSKTCNTQLCSDCYAKNKIPLSWADTFMKNIGITTRDYEQREMDNLYRLQQKCNPACYYPKTDMYVENKPLKGLPPHTYHINECSSQDARPELKSFNNEKLEFIESQCTYTRDVISCNNYIESTTNCPYASSEFMKDGDCHKLKEAKSVLIGRVKKSN
ncbi:MAG: hypothetical protein ACXWL5_04475 [Candidatus Chromulinivorax sp.]